MSVLNNFMFKRFYGLIAVGMILLIFPTVHVGPENGHEDPSIWRNVYHGGPYHHQLGSAP